MLRIVLQKISLLAVCMLFTYQITAQSGIVLYGLSKQGNPSLNTPFDVASIDPMTAAVTPLFSSNTGVAVAAGASTFDHGNKRLICWGFDNSNVERIYTADIDSGMVINQPIATSRPIEMEFDLNKQKTYGLWYDQSTGTEYFVSINLTTGATTNIASIPYNLVAIGNSTFDSNNAVYFCMVGTMGSNLKLVSINANTGAVLTSVDLSTTTDAIVNAFEYDVNTNKLHCLITETDSTIISSFGGYGNKMFFGEVDWVTGQVTKISPSPILTGEFTGYNIGGIAFDQQSQTYIGVLADDNGQDLTLIDATTGTVISKVTPTQNFWEIQCDNVSFARSFYDPTNTEEIPNQPSTVKAFPNPATDYLQLESENNIESITVVNVQGQIVRQQTITPSTNFRLNVKELISGTYFMKVQTSKGQEQITFIK